MAYEIWNVEQQDGISIAALNTGPMNCMTAGAIGELKERNEWVRTNGVPPAAGSAKGA